MIKKQKRQYKQCSECIHEWVCQSWAHGTIHNTDATSCVMYETIKGSTAYWLGLREGQAANVDRLNKAIDLMAEYIVTLGGVDRYLCDEIPVEHHLKYQPKNDGNYENEPCQKCVAEYFKIKAGEE